MALRFADVKDPAESVLLTFNFAPGLIAGSNLNGTPTVTVSTITGTDPSPTALLNGPTGFDVTLTNIIQPITGGLTNCDYQFVVTSATTNPYLTLTIVAILSVRR